MKKLFTIFALIIQHGREDQVVELAGTQLRPEAIRPAWGDRRDGRLPAAAVVEDRPVDPGDAGTEVGGVIEGGGMQGAGAGHGQSTPSLGRCSLSRVQCRQNHPSR